MTQRLLIFTAVCCLAGCSPRPSAFHRLPVGTPAPLLLGTFEDDYGIRYAISTQLWHQHPDARYRIVRWNADAQYLIAQNDGRNPTGAGLWTRIDWMNLSDMLPYEWAFCLSVYEAPTAAEAESTHVANRGTPTTGCNGYPFSRMRRPEP